MRAPEPEALSESPIATVSSRSGGLCCGAYVLVLGVGLFFFVGRQDFPSGVAVCVATGFAVLTAMLAYRYGKRRRAPFYALYRDRLVVSLGGGVKAYPLTALRSITLRETGGDETAIRTYRVNFVDRRFWIVPSEEGKALVEEMARLTGLEIKQAEGYRYRWQALLAALAIVTAPAGLVFAFEAAPGSPWGAGLFASLGCLTVAYLVRFFLADD